MPRISAGTVKEHRENIEMALVDAAEDILRNEPGAQLTAPGIASRAGIARNSIYRYVNSVGDLRRMVIERYMPKWMAAVMEATDGISDPREWLEAWIRVNLEQAATSSHGWLRNIVVAADSSGKNTPPSQPTIYNRSSFTTAGVDVDEVHQRANSHLYDVWEVLAPGQADMFTKLTMAQLGVGFRAVEDGQPVEDVTAVITRAILSLADSAPRSGTPN